MPHYSCNRNKINYLEILQSLAASLRRWHNLTDAPVDLNDTFHTKNNDQSAETEPDKCGVKKMPLAGAIALNSQSLSSGVSIYNIYFACQMFQKTLDELRK